MKSNRTHTFPPVVEDLGDGTFYYNFEVIESETEEGDREFNYQQVRCEYPVEIQKIQGCLAKENYEHQADLTGYETL